MISTVPVTAGTSYSTISQGSSLEPPPGTRSTNILTSTATQVVSPAPVGLSTVSVFLGRNTSSIAGAATLTLSSPANVTFSITRQFSAVQISSSSGPAGFTTQSVTSPSSIAVPTTSTSVSASTNATSSTALLPATVSGFKLVGCVGSATGYQSFQISENSSTMSIDRCVSDCRAYAYAGIFDTICLCSNTNISSSISTVPQGSCNQPCPGNPAELCGGRIHKAMRMVKRQTSLADILLTLYANPAILNGIAASSAISPTASMVLPTSSGGPNNAPVINNASTSFPPQASPSVPSNQTIVLTTIYIDVCSTGYTTITTTLTTTHCDCTLQGATSIDTPSIPMTTFKKTCTVCAAPGDKAPHTVTLTLPDTSAIAIASVNALSTPAGPPIVSAAAGSAVGGAAQSQATPSNIPALPDAGAASSQSISPSLPVSTLFSNDQTAAGLGINTAGTTDVRRVTVVSIPIGSPTTSMSTGDAATITMPVKIRLGVFGLAAMVAVVIG